MGHLVRDVGLNMFMPAVFTQSMKPKALRAAIQQNVKAENVRVGRSCLFASLTAVNFYGFGGLSMALALFACLASCLPHLHTAL